jgi:transcriptional regulator with PAS, ATPase and Fis domain
MSAFFRGRATCGNCAIPSNAWSLLRREAVVDVEHLPDFLREHDRNSTTFTVRPGTPLAEVERMLIRQTLTHVTSNRADAARALGISRRALQYKLKHYGLLDETASPPVAQAKSG